MKKLQDKFLTVISTANKARTNHDEIHELSFVTAAIALAEVEVSDSSISNDRKNILDKYLHHLGIRQSNLENEMKLYVSKIC
jgi:hypothetical protein